MDIVNIKKQTYILEIGPGTGNLTSKILDKVPKSLTVIEKDKRLSNLLKKNLDQELLSIIKMY